MIDCPNCQHEYHIELEAKLAEREAQIAALREAIEHFFAPGPGIATPERYEHPTDVYHTTWNEKLTRLQTAMTDTDAARAFVERIQAEERKRIALVFETAGCNQQCLEFGKG